jgi:tetratricopeptide (TPR) repeat protein
VLNSLKISIFIVSYLFITHSPLAQNYALAKSLNDSAVALIMKSEKNERIIELLDKSMAADSNYIRAYENKISILLEETKYPAALSLCNKLLRINPRSAIYNTTKGALLEKSGDTISAQKMYRIADNILSISIDSLKTTDPKYAKEIMNRLVTLTLLNKPNKAKELASSLKEMGIKTEYSEIISDFTSKSRNEVLNTILQVQN